MHFNIHYNKKQNPFHKSQQRTVQCYWQILTTQLDPVIRVMRRNNTQVIKSQKQTNSIESNDIIRPHYLCTSIISNLLVQVDLHTLCVSVFSSVYCCDSWTNGSMDFNAIWGGGLHGS